MEQTTALRKIATLKKKIRGIQGGQGAGKTIGIMTLIINHLAGKPSKEAYVISAELTKMRDTVLKDTVKILESFNIPCRVMGLDYGQAKITFPNKSFIRFIGMDKEDIGKGLRSDIVFVNEANKINFESYREATSRAKNIYIDFNPNAKFWFHEEIQPREDCDFITLTYKDNEYLPQQEVDEIEYYYKKGYDEQGNEINKYWANKWRVYGLGQIGILEGACFEDWEIIDEVPEDARAIGGGIDFGWENPCAAIMCYKLDGKWIFDQIAYGSKIDNPGLAYHIIDEGLEKHVWYADNAEPKSIKEVRDNGVNIHPCDGKTDLINFAVKILNKDTFYITKRSEETIEELYSYVWDKNSKGVPTGKPTKKNDHAMNAIEYFVATEGKYDGSYR